MSDLSSVKHLTAGTIDRPGERLMRPLDPLAASMPAGTGTIGVKPGKGQPTSSSSSSQVLPVRVGSVPKSTASKPEPQQVTTTEGGWKTTSELFSFSGISDWLCRKLVVANYALMCGELFHFSF
jgi:hypothetical protein